MPASRSSAARSGFPTFISARKHARVAELLEFLRVVDCKYLYLVGDFIDGWELKFRWFWRDDYNVLIQKLLRKSRKQTKVIYISGNHDEFIEQFMGMRFGSVTIARQVIHTAADGKKYLVIHGHQADGLTHFNHLLEKLGSHLYNWILDFNLYFNRAAPRARFRLLVAGGVFEIQGQVRREIRHRI